MRVIINNKEIGKNIRLLCEKNNKTIDEISLMAGIAKNNLINYESGRKQISIKEAIILCNLFNVKIDDFVSYQIIK